MVEYEFYTLPKLFAFLRQAPHLTAFGEGTDRLIAEYAQMTADTSSFWVEYCEVLNEIVDENEDADETPVFNIAMRLDIEARLAWRMWEGPSWLGAWFNEGLENYCYRNYPQLLRRDSWAYGDEIEWEQAFCLFYEKFGEVLVESLFEEDSL